ncbi:unnamed protein product [Heligmosomoides polygyrus]|uniref:Transmembrane protein n=1 Tax=Heligmosomoides polygyrus TaxID=6339 RepID=A0A183F775_HELPZ|nr:unnamed protein product [Heligmosomoides polygyrus]
MHLGEPLANDIADVHRRPILTRSETTDGELLRDFGEGPEVDSEGEQDFSSAFLPVGAGYNHPESMPSSESQVPKRETERVEIVNLEDETSQAEAFSTSTPLKGSKLHPSEKEGTTATNADTTSQFSSQRSLCPYQTFVPTTAAMAVYYSLFL